MWETPPSPPSNSVGIFQWYQNIFLIPASDEKKQFQEVCSLGSVAVSLKWSKTEQIAETWKNLQTYISSSFY